MRNHLKLDQLLPDADRESFLALCRHPATTAASAHQWLMDKGIRIGRNAVYAFLRRERPEKLKSRNFVLKVDRVMTPAHLRAYERLIRDPRTTEADLLHFCQKHGYALGRVAIRSHRNRLRERLRHLRQSADFARDLAQVVTEYGPEAFRGGAIAGVDQEIMQRVFELRDKDQITAEEFGQWARSLSGFAALRDHLGQAGDPAPPAGAPRDAPPRDKRRGFDGVELSNAVRRIFGVPLPGEPAPALPPPGAAQPAPPLPCTQGRGSG